jgi:group II intron reverse transcriptase/maturase
MEEREMRKTNIVIGIHQDRGSKGLPLERVYRHLFNPELFLTAYGKIYRNAGAMTKGSTDETVDGMSLLKIHQIIGLLKLERYRWTPVRRTEIPKEKGGTRPLGIPTWGDKLVQEALRSLIEPYYELRFSNRSHGFRPKRSCHSALREVQRTWKGTVWFIEGDVTKCFDSFDHEVMLSIIRRDIHDGRVITLIDGLLRAGYMEDWRYHETLAGTPQGGIISPLLSNIYLTELDRFVEDTLIPEYTVGKHKQLNEEYRLLDVDIGRERRHGNFDEVKRLKRERRKLPSGDPCDPNYRRLRYIRYADDFLLGFVGPKKEAEDIRERLREFLASQLKLTLSQEKTLITHAGDDKAKFLGHEIMVVREGDLISDNGMRATNGRIALLMPRKVVLKQMQRFSKEGKVTHRPEITSDRDYTIIRRYQSILQGIYNFYCMSANVAKRMAYIRWILERSLTKTLACKFQIRVSQVYKKYRVIVQERKMLQVTIQRPGKNPLVATFAGFPCERVPNGMGVTDFSLQLAWNAPGNKRSEVVQRLLAGKCELCGVENVPLEIHHIRRLADIDKPGRRPKPAWAKIMSARRRKTLAVCEGCHDDIHAGRYDGQRK